MYALYMEYFYLHSDTYMNHHPSNLQRLFISWRLEDYVPLNMIGGAGSWGMTLTSDFCHTWRIIPGIVTGCLTPEFYNPQNCVITGIIIYVTYNIYIYTYNSSSAEESYIYIYILCHWAISVVCLAIL